MIIFIKNISGEVKQLHIHEFQVDELLEIDTTWYIDAVIQEISAGNFCLFNQDGIINGLTNQLRWLRGNLPTDVNVTNTPVFTPTAPKNEFNLKPFGLHHAHINSAEHLFTITLSNKNGTTYDYVCDIDPKYYDCVFQNHSVTRDGVLSVDVGNKKVTFFYGNMTEGEALLSTPVKIDYQLSQVEGIPIWYLWGAYISARDYGEDDLARLQIVDTIGVGVHLGLYTPEQFEAMGGEYVLKEYDECWIHQIDRLIHLHTPDGAPGELPPGIVLRSLYYPKDVTKTDIKFWCDYILTSKDGDQ